MGELWVYNVYPGICATYGYRYMGEPWVYYVCSGCIRTCRYTLARAAVYVPSMGELWVYYVVYSGTIGTLARAVCVLPMGILCTL
jgi:hypothetical protein